MKIEQIVIETAIAEKRELKLTLFCPVDGEKGFKLQPYLRGIDVLGFPFIWGYLPEYETYYKVNEDLVIDMIETGETFSFREGTVFYCYGDADVSPDTAEVEVVEVS